MLEGLEKEAREKRKELCETTSVTVLSANSLGRIVLSALLLQSRIRGFYE
jgi:hypothetical protein